jgi:hypothetical protein
MSDPVEPNDDDDDQGMTLDPPGSIAVVGSGVIGIEAALYGRFLGYEVTLIEAVAVGHSMSDLKETPLSMLPDRCLSPLAASALQTQQRDSPHMVLPTTFGQWIDNVLIPLTESDLLRGRLRMPVRVTEIGLIAVEADEDDDDSSRIPPDFRLTLVDSGGEKDWIDVEAVILAVGSNCDIKVRFEAPNPYFFRIAADSNASPERDLRSGLREIVAVFAELSGRSEMDLYRPLRG